MSARLSDGTLAQARGAVPGYDRRALGVGMVHLGLGAFVRAHVAVYTDDVLAREFGDWGIAGVSLNRPDQRDRLAPQDGLYTLLERDSDTVSARVIGCLKQAIFAPEDPAALVALMADPATHIISLTVTEKGYCLDRATGRLDAAHPDIVHDLANPLAPRSAPGFIVAALRARRAAGVAAPTVLSCDNLPHNGHLLAGLIRDFAALGDDGLAGWIEAEVAFPCTMVDRIVPASTEAELQDAVALTGLEDAAPVSHEVFRQWVIEDRFVGPRPAWERAGAQMVADVAPWEHMKLRLLNGAHSALAYLGLLAGHETVADAVAAPALRAEIEALWRDELVPAVPPPPGVDLHGYTRELMARFANSAVRHRLAQIAMDGSQKLPQRLLAPLRERMAAGQASPRIARAVAAWIIHLEGGTARDPLAGALQDAIAANPADPVRAVLGNIAVFGADLAGSAPFHSLIAGAYADLRAGRSI